MSTHNGQDHNRHSAKIKRNFLIWVRFVSFAAVGVVGTIGHYVALMILVEKIDADPLIGTTLGFLIGAFINYILNYHLTFHSKTPHCIAAPRFFTIAAFGMGLNAVLMLLFVRFFGLYYLLGQGIATCFVLLFNFILNNAWTFRRSGG